MTAATSGPWKRRIQRAHALSERQTHARELLDFYADLLGIQERTWTRAVTSGWPTTLGPLREARPRLGLEDAAVAAMDVDLVDMLSHLTSCTSATDVIRHIAARLRDADADTREAVVRGTLERGTLGDLPSALDVDERQLRFIGRAFGEAITEAARADQPGLDSSRSTTCPACGWPPQVATVQDEADVKGGKALQCSLCARLWSFPRVVCASCLESRPDELDVHVHESMSHVQIDACRTCGRYLKSINLRLDGRAVPEVDDVGTPELDLWAREQGLTRIEPGILGV